MKELDIQKFINDSPTQHVYKASLGSRVLEGSLVIRVGIEGRGDNIWGIIDEDGGGVDWCGTMDEAKAQGGWWFTSSEVPTSIYDLPRRFGWTVYPN